MPETPQQPPSAGHRRTLVLAGEPQWALESARHLMESLPEGSSRLWISDRAPAGARALTRTRAHRILGRELDAAVYDAFGGFDAEAFGAVTGSVRGGGMLLLLTPSLDQWAAYPDPDHARIAVFPHTGADVSGRFLARLGRILRDASGVTVLEEPGAPLPAITVSPAARQAREDIHLTPDQERAVEALMHVATGHRRRPVVLTSDRGRGKSAALGIAAARLLASGTRRIVITGPSAQACEPAFEHAGRLLNDADISHKNLLLHDSRIEYVAPDALALQPVEANLVLVDEAAAIPAPLLESLLIRYSRIAFSTTVHGYEGSGRGFTVRFQRTLDRRTPDWKALRLLTPIRWATGDPLERLVFGALLLDAAPAPEQAVEAATPQRCTLEELDRDALAGDEATLSELFGLLMLAHYRTRPTDLRHLLDGINISVHVLRFGGHIVATALVAREGGLDAATARAIYQRRRRPHGHLLPETLAAHLGLEQAPLLRCDRIMRIAVHPAAWNRGLGTHLLESLVERARRMGMDYVGSSFGATLELLRFWDRSGFRPVRLGIKRGAASGEHSAIVMHPLSAEGTILAAQARGRFLDQYPLWLGDPLRDVDPLLAAHLLLAPDRPPQTRLDTLDIRDLREFAFGLRGYEVTLLALWKLIRIAFSDPAPPSLLGRDERYALIARILQKRPFTEVATQLGLAGRNAVVRLIKQATGKLVEALNRGTGNES